MEISPYIPPAGELNSGPPASGATKWSARIGILLFSGPFFGLLGTVIAMLQAFSILAENDASDPSELAENIRVALTAAMIGLVTGIVGVVLVFLSLLKFGNRELWFSKWATGLAICWCIFIFPLGLLVGLPVIHSFRARRDEFM